MVADLTQVAGLALIVVAAFLVNVALGVVAAGIALLLVGLALDPRIGRRIE